MGAEPLEHRELLAVVGPWTTLDAMPARRDNLTSYIQPKAAQPITIDSATLATLLKNAPLEFTAAATAPLEFSLPMPDGSFDRFAVVEAPIMEPGLAAKFPDIKTYRGQGIDDPAATLRFDVTPLGFHAQILSPNGAAYIDPYYHLDTSLYISYLKSDLTNTQPWVELEDPGDEALKSATVVAAPTAFIGPVVPVGVAKGRTESLGSGTVDPAGFATAGGPDLFKSGTQLRTYRTAVAATGEYTAFFGGTVAQGQAAIVVAMNRLNQVYESELSIRMTLVANNDLLVYTNAATDPYTNSSGSTMLGQNQTNLNAVIGNSSYDIGHVFSTGGGGVATLGSVGVNSIKARGVTGRGSPIGDAFYIDYVAHEMGHQYGGTHTFNTANDLSNRTASTAYEPGSGSTIQAYAGITGDDLQSNSDPYFHFISLEQMINHVDVVIPGVGTRTATGNIVPVVSAGPSTFIIPTGTPFELTATGSDDNGDTLTYSWEERDLGAAQTLVQADNGASPIFRVWNPTTSPTRTFPRLSNLLNNTLPLGEKLPALARTQMKFRVTARDNRSGGGAVNWADNFVQVVNTGAPFLVTSPNTPVTWNSGTTQTVTWNVAGTNSGLVNTPNVNIRLSTDGGQTFPITLASNVPNDGSQDIMVPNLGTTTARIRVEGAGNIFFDLSNANFTISNADVTPPTVDILDVTPDPRNTPVGSVSIVFSEAVNGFDLADLTLTRNGGANLLTGAQTLTTSDNITFSLNNLSGITAPDGTYLLTLTSAGSGITDLASNPLVANANDSWLMQTTLIVTGVIPTSGGVVVNFNKPIDPVPLNLYDTSAGLLGPADLTLVGPGGAVKGSLIIAPDNLSVTFVATGGLLPSNNYTLTLRSAADGFKDSGGALLDGDANGTAGDNYSALIATGANGNYLYFPDFARGPGQPVDVPATSSGLPLAISDGTGVTSVSLRINYLPALLILNSVAPGPDAPGGAVVNLDTSTPGYALLTYSGPTLPSGVARFASLTAMVPTTAPYGSKQVLTFSEISVNTAPIATLGDPAVHVVGYFGDASGNGAISALDAAFTNRIAASIDTGFVAYQLADPTIIADINGSGNISALDAALVNRFAASIPTPEIPPIPTGLSLTPAGLDPKISLPKNLIVRPGEALSVPVRIENTDVVPVGLEAFDLAIRLDPRAFRVKSVRSPGYDVTWSFDQKTGLLMITAARPGGPVTMVPGESGMLAQIELVARVGAPEGSRSLNLLGSVRANGADRKTALNEGRLVLIPAPTNAENDEVDGRVMIAKARQTVPAALGAAGVPLLLVPQAESPFATRPMETLTRRGKGSTGRKENR